MGDCIHVQIIPHMADGDVSGVDRQSAGAHLLPPDYQDDCDREPIHIPGAIQPHGALFVVAPDGSSVLQAAIGPIGLGIAAKDAIGRDPRDLLPESTALRGDWVRLLPDFGAVHLEMLRVSGALCHLIAHRVGGAIVVELEQASDEEPGSFDAAYPHVRDFLDRLRRTAGIQELAALAAREVRRITGLDRALVYQFDEDWRGAVIAEDGNGNLPSYLGLRFPASDIPAQARTLYQSNRLRLIANADYSPVPIEPALNPLTGLPVDLGFSVLRGVSPVHLEYMRNMGTMASMSISLMREDRLWGLIACHGRDPARPPYHIRTACDFIAQVLSIELAAREAKALSDQRNLLRAGQRRLLARMAGAPDFGDALMAAGRDLLALTGAAGAAILTKGACRLVGDAPDEPAIGRLVKFLARRQRDEIFVTDALTLLMPDGEDLRERASGVLAISISQIHESYLLWFRPEVIRTVNWGGDPNKPVHPPGQDHDDGAVRRLYPRKSFESWRETVERHSHPWNRAEIEAASDLRAAIVDIVLRQAEEMAAVSERLASTNKELEAFSYSVSHDLRAPFRHIVGYAQLLKRFEGDRLTGRGRRYLDIIVESAVSAGTLVDELLHFSQMGRATLTPIPLDMNALVREMKAGLTVDGNDGTAGAAVDWRIADLPPVRADPVMMRLVLQNLLENALKFSRGRSPAVIEVGAAADDRRIVYFVRDNGAGFDMAYVGKLFGVFQRLHRVEDYEGTGIGLANVKRIVERHGGRVWAEGKIDAGATFFFSLPSGEPRPGEQQDRGNMDLNDERGG